MIAAISYLQQQQCSTPIQLVCSGHLPNESNLFGLGELDDEQLIDHYNSKITLKNSDLQLAKRIWYIYCSEDHSKLKPSLAKDSSFLYLSNCISAHKERFPEARKGFNTLETKVLKLIQEHKVSSERHLCSYLLQYQGYYGFGDTQLFKLIERMRPYFNLKEGTLVVNAFAKAVLEGKENAYQKIKHDAYFGGASKFDFLYNSENHQLIKR